MRLIDPTCGSGHFLLGAFQRLFDVWARNEPARNARDTVQQALNGVYGVDLNPFAVAIARFRLLLAALKACDITRLMDAPAFKFNIATGDSLLHGRRFRELDLGGEHQAAERHGYAHTYAIEDLDEVNRILGQQYHAVVGNPPYITVKDAVLNQVYRARYSSCHMKYSLGVPFAQRFFELALSGDARHPAGYVGMITTNSFMKREFGSKLIEEYLPAVDLTHVIDTSGAYIPGHGTPTVILLGRDRRPVGDTVRTVMGIKGEPSTPDDPAQGLVWRAIVTQVDQAGSESAFISVADTPRVIFATHPWSIGGGGAAELKAAVEEGRLTLGASVSVIGIFGMTNADEVMLAPASAFQRRSVETEGVRPLVIGDMIRDWSIQDGDLSVFPYDGERLLPVSALPQLHHWLWPCRTTMGNRATFAKKTYFAEGRPWWEWHQVAMERLNTPLSIELAFVATHNHFVLDRGGKVFNRSAPVIKLLAGASEDEHLGLLGLLNSSLACFWMQQAFHNKGGPGGGSSKDEKWHDFFEHSGTQLQNFPVAADAPLELARELDRLAQKLATLAPSKVIATSVGLALGSALRLASEEVASTRRRMITLQEELDWRCYGLYGLLEAAPDYPNPPEIELGHRAFEIVMAQRMAAEELETKWFDWLRIKPTTGLPTLWPDDYKRIVEKRIALIESDKFIGLIESPNCKRRWESEPWEEQEQRALRSWLLDRLEGPRYWSGDPQLKSVSRLADAARQDAEFMQVAELYAGRADFDVAQLTAELVAAEAVPFLPVLRYADSGLRKRAEWEACWARQRQEDAIDAQVAAENPRRAEESEDDYSKRLAADQKRRKAQEVGDIPVPPKYKSADFLKTDFWRLRGGLDVPKERFVSYPGCERGADGSLVIAWAGRDHLQQATALAAYYLDMKDNEGWPPERLQPLLAGLLELVPWLKQWHNDYNPDHATRMGDYFESFVIDEARTLGCTLDNLRAWKPAVTAARRGRQRVSTR